MLWADEFGVCVLCTLPELLQREKDFLSFDGGLDGSVFISTSEVFFLFIVKFGAQAQFQVIQIISSP